MHGVVKHSKAQGIGAPTTSWRTLRSLIQRFRVFGLLVVLPTVLIATYYYFIASDQYESTAAFVVRKADSGISAPSGLGQVLGMSFGASQTQSEAYLLEDYLLSHDAVARLQSEDQIVQRFRRPGIDFFSRLWSDQPKPETLLKYYRKRVSLSQDTETGISHVSVVGFTPRDAYHINQKLLRMGEERINALNVRTFNDQVSQSRKDFEIAEKNLAEIQKEMNLLRQVGGDIDPQGTGRAQIGLVATLTGNLVEARSKLAAMGRLISPHSPQYRALAAQVGALEAQVAGQQNRLAGVNSNTIADKLGDYEQLSIRREFAAQRFNASAASYEQAKAEARKKQLYLIRVVDANMPVKSLFPERGRIVLTVAAALFLAYAIGRMLIAGLREHSL